MTTDSYDDWVARDAAVVWHGFTQMAAYTDNAPLIVERAEGRELIDVDGKRYLDAISSLWVTTLGHRVPELDIALVDQVQRVAHSTLLGNGNRVVIEFAEALARVVPVDGPHVLFASDGAAAVEQALKIAFQYWTNQGVTGRTAYLAFGGAYHGDTVGSLSIGAGGFGTDVFDPLRFPVVRAPGFDDPDCIAAACALVREHAERLAAVVVEPLVQGAAGIQTLEAGHFAALGEACREAGVLLICDEVATGFGRTGTLFASEQCGLRPDLLCLGKGLTAGYLAQSATVASDRVYAQFLGEDLGERTFYHGHSYSGNALAAAVGLRHLQLLEEWDVLANVGDRADQFTDLLAARIAPLDGVAEVRQQGLMVGIELSPPTEGQRWGRRVSAGCVERGVLIRPLGDVVIVMPPLTITADEVERIVATVAEAIAEVADADTPGLMPARSAWDEWVHQRNLAVATSGRRREVRDLEGGRPQTTLSADGRPVVSFASNDYLGLSQHPTVIEASRAATAALGTGAGSARLIVGARPVHRQLEDDLAAWKGTEAALLFSTGFAANLGVLATLGADPETLIVSDELNHASIIDGARLARAQVAVAVHRDVDHVAALLDDHPSRAIVVTDSVFSMDGDLAPVDELAAVCADRGALLVLDEAHAVLGPATPRLEGLDVAVVGTLSKTLGSLGGFLAAPRAYVDLLTSTARSFIFTTATPPGDAAAAQAALAVVRSTAGDRLRADLRAHIDRLLPGHPSPIIPVLLGDEDRALAVADALLQQGLLVPAIRPPTVAPGTCRLRIALSAAHTPEQVETLAVALEQLGCAP